MRKEVPEWLITSTHGGDPERLSEIAIMSDEDELALDEIFNRDFDVEISDNLFESSHFVHSLQKVVLKNLEDILVLFHEASHGITDNQDPVVKKIKGKLEGMIRAGEMSDNLDMAEIQELLTIRAERMASAYALKKIREIKKQRGIDLLDGQDFNSVRDRIHHGIESAFDKIKSTKEYKDKFNALREAMLKSKKK